MAVVPFLLHSNARLEQARLRLAAAVEAWAAAWGVDPGVPLLTLQRASGPAVTTPWRQAWQGSAAQGWADWQPAFMTAVQDMVFAPDGSHAVQLADTGSLAHEAAQAALDDLLLALRQALCLTAGVAQLAVPGAGAAIPGGVLAHLQFGRERLALLFDSACMEILAGAPGADLEPLVPVDMFGALATVPVRLTVSAGTARVGAGSLLGLGPGDVVRLDARLDEPLSLLGPRQQPVLEAWLGKSGEVVAVELSGATI